MGLQSQTQLSACTCSHTYTHTQVQMYHFKNKYCTEKWPPQKMFLYLKLAISILCFHLLTSHGNEGWQSPGLKRHSAISWLTLSLSLQFSTSLTISTCPYGLSPGIRIFKAILSLNSWADMQQCSGHCELNKHKVMFLFSRNLWSHWKLWNYT